MQQLEQRFYNREEIAGVTGTNLADKSHFARNCKNTLTNWGYSFTYSCKGVTITGVPTTEEERLAEIMVRVFDLDIRIDALEFATFIYCVMYLEGFAATPWLERQKILKEDFGLEISERTLRGWSSILIGDNYMIKGGDRITWMTYYCQDTKCREMVTGDEELERTYEKYLKDKRNYLEQIKKDRPAWGKAEQYKAVMSRLWTENKCCFYNCQQLVLNVLKEESLEIFELVETIYEIGDKTEKVICYNQTTSPKVANFTGF